MVAAGGAGGAVLRWLLGEVVPTGPASRGPRSGSTSWARSCWPRLPAIAVVRRRELLAVALGPGVLGGFTTMSTYADQGRGLLADGRPALAAAYLFGTLAACLLGVALAHRLSTPDAQWQFDAEEGNE